MQLRIASIRRRCHLRESGTNEIRLEWVEAGTLTPHPKNWRRHPDSQMRALADVLKDPSIGWAGACLYNELTGRLIDGHARCKAVAPETIVPVLIGSWSEEAEKKILLTLDPIGDLATADTAELDALLSEVEIDSEALKFVVENIEAEMADEDLLAGSDGKEFDEAAADDVETIKCPSCGHEFPQ